MTQLEQCPTCGSSQEAGTTACQQCGVNLAQAAQLAALAARVAALEQLLAVQPAPIVAPLAEKEGAEVVETAVSAPPPPQKPLLPPEVWQSDFWLNKVGIGLLLLALAFLFNYAIDQGWLTPAVRVGMGLLLGSFLLGMGYRLRHTRPQFSQVLSGGGIAAYYLSGFAAFQLYQLVPHTAAFGFMCLVTLLSLFLALRQQAVVLSLIGGLGGLATPFLLNTGSGNIIALLIYSSLLTAGLTAVYVFQGWRLLHWLANVGGWLIVLVGMIAEDVSQLSRVSSEGIAVQAAILFGLLLFWAVPVGRELLLFRQPDRLPVARLGAGDGWLGPRLRRFFDAHAPLSTLINPLIGWLLTIALWSLERPIIGWLTLATAVFFALLAWVIHRLAAHATLSYSHGLTAVFLLTFSLLLLLEDDWLLLALAIEAAGLLLATRWLDRLSLRGLAHLLAFAVGMWLLGRLVDGVGLGEGETAVFNLPALINLAIIILTAAVTFGFPSNATMAKTIYRLAAHVALLLWLWRELSQLDGGQGLVTIAWGIYAVALLLLALRYRQRQARLIALGTLFLLVGKLFLVDLAAVETVWRILLFAGFGGLFLLISYYYGAWLGLTNEGDE